MSTGFQELGRNRQLQDHWLRRLIAFIIDNVILSLVVLVVGGIISLFVALSGSPLAFLNLLTFPLFQGIASVLYFTLLEHVYGQTFGKYVMRLKVSDIQNRPLTLGQAFVRNVSKIYWILLILDLVFGLAMPGNPHQKASDRLIGTTVNSSVAQPMFIMPEGTRPTKNCLSCGESIAAEAKYCPKCGKEQI
jgi:uncharacterized RDD family membrane protein YckC